MNNKKTNKVFFNVLFSFKNIIPICMSNKPKFSTQDFFLSIKTKLSLKTNRPVDPLIEITFLGYRK